MQIVARWCCTSAVLLTILSTAHQASGTDSTFEAPIGMSATIEELILPGSELEVKPLANDPLVVLRITKVFQHGSSFRYHFTYYGLEPGSYDLANYLQRKDGSTVNDLPPIQVKVSGILPPGQVTPNPLKTAKSPAMGGYGLLLTLGAIVWVIGLFLLLRPDRRRNATDLQTSRPAAMTLADRLQPLVTSAANGSLTDSQRAELERVTGHVERPALPACARERRDFYLDELPGEAEGEGSGAGEGSRVGRVRRICDRALAMREARLRLAHGRR